MDNDLKSQYARWEFHVGRINETEGLTDRQKEYVITGFNKIRGIFGEDWLKQAIDDRHPLFEYYMTNQVPSAYLFLADFGNRLSEIAGIKNFEIICKRLRNFDTYDNYLAVEAEFETVSFLKRAGLEVEVLAPYKKRKTPDMIARFGGSEIFFEVTRLGSSTDWKNAHQTYTDLTLPVLFDTGVNICGVIHKTLSTPHRKELQSEISAAVNRAKLEKKSIGVFEDGVIDLLISPREDIEYLKRWLKKKGFDMGIRGPPMQPQELKRIKRDIFEKSKQIPAEKQGVLVIYANELLEDLEERKAHTKIVSELEETINEYQGLLGVVLLTSSIIPYSPPKLIEGTNYFVVINNPYRLLQRSCIVIKNRYTKFDTSILNFFRSGI